MRTANRCTAENGRNGYAPTMGRTMREDADPRDYPVGQGVYHSSYKNALRYTRTTTNIAYRTADYERYQTEDFVLGIDIRITAGPDHTEDICDTLQGRYPKEFKWVGWHPQCRCIQTPVLATVEEVNAMADAIMQGRDPSEVAVQGRVTDVPDNYKQWLKDNANRIKSAKELAYFLRDNGERVDGVYTLKTFGKKTATPKEIAKERHAALLLLKLPTLKNVLLNVCK